MESPSIDSDLSSSTSSSESDIQDLQGVIDLENNIPPVFIELLELQTYPDGFQEWKEISRWIKYEEDLNAEKGQWGKPHVATLSFKALVNLRLCMEGGTLMLDVTVRDLPELLHRYI